MNLAELKEPFEPADVSWRIGQCGKSGEKVWAKVLAYIDNRCIMDRLDKVVGPDKWRNEYAKGPEGGVLCGLSIKIGDEWVTKWDGADNTDIEATKGGLSDAMKRAAVQWGIGRYLYDLGENFAETSLERKQGWHFAKSKDAGSFYWSPPKGVLEPPKAKREQLPVAGRAPSPGAETVKQLASETPGLKIADEIVPPEWQAKLADAQQQVAKAETPEALEELIDGWKALAFPEPVKAALRPLYSARKALLLGSTAGQSA